LPGGGGGCGSFDNRWAEGVRGKNRRSSSAAAFTLASPCPNIGIVFRADSNERGGVGLRVVQLEVSEVA